MVRLTTLPLVVLAADALSVDTSRMLEALATREPVASAPKAHSIALGSRMEITVPTMGDRSKSWIPCNVTDREDFPDRYVISIDGFPEKIKFLHNVPASALRPAPATGFNFLEDSDKAVAAGKAALAYGLGKVLAAPPNFDCGKFPEFCRAPFNCQTFSPMEGMDWYYHGMAKSGKANPRTWCSMPTNVAYLSTCLTKGDLLKAAQIRQNASMKESEVDRELDASRCFIEGFCSDTAVSRTTTLDQANQLCNLRYGQERWGMYATYRAAPEDSHGAGGPHGGVDGYKGKQQTTPVTLGTCATGKYHCDVMYCKMTYCKQDTYRRKYSHLAQPL